MYRLRGDFPTPCPFIVTNYGCGTLRHINCGVLCDPFAEPQRKKVLLYTVMKSSATTNCKGGSNVPSSDLGYPTGLLSCSCTRHRHYPERLRDPVYSEKSKDSRYVATLYINGGVCAPSLQTRSASSWLQRFVFGEEAPPHPSEQSPRSSLQAVHLIHTCISHLLVQ